MCQSLPVFIGEIMLYNPFISDGYSKSKVPVLMVQFAFLFNRSLFFIVLVKFLDAPIRTISALSKTRISPPSGIHRSAARSLVSVATFEFPLSPAAVKQFSYRVNS